MSGNNQNDDDLKRRLRKHNDERLYLEADELMCEAADRIEQLEKERDELLADAMRYQWLRKKLALIVTMFPEHTCGFLQRGIGLMSTIKEPRTQQLTQPSPN